MDKKSDLEMGMAIDFRNKLRAIMNKYAQVMKPEFVAREMHAVAHEMEAATQRTTIAPTTLTPLGQANAGHGGHNFSWEDIELIR